ncbi:MAG: exodeoxyribonuclease VII large subunit [Eubacterium sp.]|nr:exodeoxyribonuclease VII large subunit [Eubacterium sp.]
MNVLTVTQVNTYIKALLDESAPLRNIYISGEISNFTHYYRTGHLYFTLKDESSQLKAVMFSSNASRLRFQAENGMKVICRGRISVYSKSGEYQLYVDDMQPDGVGALSLAFEQLKKKLSQEGLFDETHKKPIPPFPSKIGVATSNIGAAVEDIKNITARRYPLAEIIICPTVVQGENAPADIVRSIKMLDGFDGIDVIILGRGGGSAEDLWAFNSEEVARAVFACETPIVSAVGHETDFTICDFVSDLRAPTPSAAAELVCPDINKLYSDLSVKKNALDFYIANRIETLEQDLCDITQNGAFADAESFFAAYQDNLEVLSERLNDAFSFTIDDKENKFLNASARLEALSPLSVLMRGYCVASKNGKAVKSKNDIKKDDELTLCFADGRVDISVGEVL